jgi:hypothetical protein
MPIQRPEAIIHSNYTGHLIPKKNILKELLIDMNVDILILISYILIIT